MILSNSQWTRWSELSSNKVDLTFPILTLLSISLAIFFYISRKTTSRLPPGPRGVPVLGYLPFLGTNLHHEFTKLSHRFGPIFKLHLGSKTWIVVNSSDLAKSVLRDQDDIFANRDPPLAGLILTYGGKDISWSDNNSYLRNLRRVFVYEIMSNKNLEASLSFRQSGVRKTINHVYKTIGTEVDIGEIAFQTSLRVITSILWGKSVNEDEQSSKLGDIDGFREVITGAMDLLVGNISDFFPVLARFDLQGVQRKMKLQFHKLDGVIQNIIDDRLISLEHEESTEQKGRKDFLQILLELKEEKNASSFTITQIKALLVDFFLAGTDTTTTMSEWTMAELLENPDEMKKIQDELEQVVGKNNIVEESHLPKLRSLDAAIKETFRLHPALPFLIGRCPKKTCKLGEYVVPKGSNVFLNTWAIHRDPQYWDNPSKFDPNRFMNTDGTTKFDYYGLNTNFLAFGSGRRRCPGIPLGEKMLVYFMASLLHSFNWTLPNVNEHEMVDKFGIVLKKLKPLKAIASERLAHKDLYMC